MSYCKADPAILLVEERRKIMKNSFQYISSPGSDLKLEYTDDSVIIKDEHPEGRRREIFQSNTEIFSKSRKLRII